MLRTSRSAHHDALASGPYEGKFPTSQPMGRKQYRFHCGTNLLTEWVLYRTREEHSSDPEVRVARGMWTGGGV